MNSYSEELSLSLGIHHNITAGAEYIFNEFSAEHTPNFCSLNSLRLYMSVKDTYPAPSYQAIR